MGYKLDYIYDWTIKLSLDEYEDSNSDSSSEKSVKADACSIKNQLSKGIGEISSKEDLSIKTNVKCELFNPTLTKSLKKKDNKASKRALYMAKNCVSELDRGPITK